VPSTALVYVLQVVLRPPQLAFAQHQAEIAKMGQFDNVCAEKLDWGASLIGKYLFHFVIVFKITKYSVIVSKNTLNFFMSSTLNLPQQYTIISFTIFAFRKTFLKPLKDLITKLCLEHNRVLLLFLITYPVRVSPGPLCQYHSVLFIEDTRAEVKKKIVLVFLSSRPASTMDFRN